MKYECLIFEALGSLNKIYSSANFGLLLFFMSAVMIVAPLAGGTITLVHANLLNELFAGRLEIVGQSQPSHRLDEARTRVETIARKLSCFVVPGKRVVVVVPALAEGKKRDRRVLRRLDISVNKDATLSQNLPCICHGTAPGP